MSIEETESIEEADSIEERGSTEELGAALDRLWEVINARRGSDPRISYTARLFSRGRAKIAQKLGEEAVEAV
ncbi:MAG TPA: phosphoribosyl-ATP diphosphatase, partial [Stellaceae bacterium]